MSTQYLQVASKDKPNNFYYRRWVSDELETDLSTFTNFSIDQNSFNR